MNNRGWGAALAAVNIAAVIFGSTALFGKLPVSPIWIVAARGAFAALALLGVAVIRRTSFRVSGARLAGAAATGGLLALHWASFFAAVQWTDIAVATLTFATFPLFGIIFQAAQTRSWPNSIEMGAGAAIVLAVALIAGSGLPHTTMAAPGAIIGLISAVAFAAFGLASQAINRDGDPVQLSLLQNLFVALFTAPFLAFASSEPRAGSDWFALVALGVLASALPHQLYFFALKRLPAAVCGAFVSLEPVYAIMLAAILLGEPIGPVVAISAAIIIAASLLLLWRSTAA